MADDQTNEQGENPNDAVDPRQNEPRTGIPGKGFDAGTGYGGGGNDSLYSAESSYGGQSGVGGSRMQGAYSGEDYGRTGDDDAAGESGASEPLNAARDTDGRGSANTAGDAPVDPNVDAVTRAFDGPDAIDLQDMSGASRREPGR